MLDMYSEYIIWYVVLGIVHFLWCYGVTVRKITIYNSFPYNKNYRIVWWHLILVEGFFWPIGLILRIVRKISTIGV